MLGKEGVLAQVATQTPERRESTRPALEYLRRPVLWVVGLSVAFMAGLLALILQRTNGHFTYTLDDPYIHLALAEQISKGHYGLNPEESSSPSSSFVWPMLLAPLARTAAFEWGPLLLCALATMITAALMVHAARLVTRRTWTSVCLSMAILVSINVFGLAFTGMEHSLHVAASLAVGLGMVTYERTRICPWWMTLGIVAGPLIRYEGMLLSGLAVLAFWLWGERRRAVTLFASCAVSVASFSVFLLHLGLEPLPSSVLVKTAGQDSISGLGAGMSAWALGQQLLAPLQVPLVALLTCLVLVDTVLRRRLSTRNWFVPALLYGHLTVSWMGSHQRYWIYAIAACVPYCLLMLQTCMRSIRVATIRTGAGMVVGAFLAFSLLPVMSFTWVVPLTSANVHEQQGQTARFIDEYWQASAAVNDIGLVGLRSDEYVLDVWGLANSDARRARLEQREGWMGAIVDKHDVGLVMVTESWFPGAIPPGWLRLGTLARSGPYLTGLGEEWGEGVAIYATSVHDGERLCPRLRAFADALPAGARLDLTCLSN